jgi:hypothetical protein
MSPRFLRITHCLINVNQIRRIDINPGAYKIHLIPNEIKGLTLMGTGYFTSETESYTATEKDNIIDYKLIDEWIKNIENSKNEKVWY